MWILAEEIVDSEPLTKLELEVCKYNSQTRYLKIK